MLPRPLELSVLAAWSLLASFESGAASGDDTALKANVKQLCRDYIAGFGSPSTNVMYNRRLDGPKGIAVLESPDQIAKGLVRGKPVPFGYGSGIQDVALDNGQFLFALCDAYEATGDDYLAETAKHIFSGMKLVATVSPEPGFVPRGPHPDGKSYYRNSSMDQHTTFVYALWRYYHSSLATADDKAVIADALHKVARRMERNGWKILVEDGSEVAHVGFSWLGFVSGHVRILLSVLAAVHDVTSDEHWGELYEKFGQERDAARWKLLQPDNIADERPFTLYSNQFAVGLAVLSRVETEPERRAQLAGFRRAHAERALRSNVFDEQYWRRLDWAGDWSEEDMRRALEPFGLSLQSTATVSDLYRSFDPQMWSSDDWKRRKVNGKLCFGIPTVAFHMALLSEDAELIREVAPSVRDMVDAMLQHGHLYNGGEDFNRAVILGLHLLAIESRVSGDA